MKNKIKKVLVLIILMILILSIPGSVQANVQSVKNNYTDRTNYKCTIGLQDGFLKIRQMESCTGPMGLNATINSSTGEETSDSNNIDAHMIKNTEWGAMVMLMDSDYGSKQSGNGTWDTSSSTGNATGIYEIFYGNEWVAGMIKTKNKYNEILYNTIKDGKSKYVNLYTNRTDATDFSDYKIGDATAETVRWKNPINCSFVTSTNCMFLRGAGGAFSFENQQGHGAGSISTYITTRAVVVCGLRILKVRSIYLK